MAWPSSGRGRAGPGRRAHRGPRARPGRGSGPGRRPPRRGTGVGPVVELQALHLDPVPALETAEAVARVHVQHDCQVRPDVAGGPARDLLDLPDVEVARRPGRPGSSRRSGRSPPTSPRSSAGMTTVSTCSDLSAAYSSTSVRWRAPPVSASGRCGADLLADGGVAGLEGQADDVSQRLEPVGEESDWVDFPEPSPPSKQTKTPRGRNVP